MSTSSTKRGRNMAIIEQSENAVIKEGKRLFKPLINEFRDELPKVIGNLDGMDGEELLFTYGVLHFWCMDAILRLAQKAAPMDDSIDWPYTLKQLSLSIRRFDLDLLVWVAIKSQDLSSILDLIRIWVCRQEYPSLAGFEVTTEAAVGI